MTTYTLSNGLAVYYDPTDGEEDTVLGMDNVSITLELVVPATTTSLSYIVNPLEPGDAPGEGNETVDITVDDYTVRIHGMTVGDGTPIDPEISIFEVNWTDEFGVSQTSTVLVPVIDGITVSGLGLVDADYIFVIDGEPLPTFASPGAWAAFDGSITSIGVPTGPYGPGSVIPLTSLGGTVSENDIITGTNAQDVFKGGAGNDVMHVFGGNDRLFGGSGDDKLFGDNGHDRLLGGNGNDRLFGGNGNDRLFGNNGNDRLFGGSGDDELHGGAGADILTPGNNNFGDALYTGNGSDHIVFSASTSGFFSIRHEDLTVRVVVTIDGNANTGTIKKTGAGITTITDAKKPMLADGLEVQGTSLGDIFNITVADGGWMQVLGGAGKDSFNIGTSTGKLVLDFQDSSGTSTGIDVDLGAGTIKDDGFGNVEAITGPGQVWQVRGTQENDKIIGSANDESFILMGGNDVVNGRAGADVIFGGEGADTLKGGADNDILKGNAGKDTLEGGIGSDRLEGGAGDDTLKGGNGNDRILGGVGKDSLDGGVGNDRMTGNGGADTFIFGPGTDIVTDFSTADSAEKIDLSGVTSIIGADDLAKFNDLTNEHLSEVNGNVVIDDLAGNTMTLNGVGIADLNQDDFIF